MYHIKSDRRSRASAAQIVRGLEECLQKKPLNAITVADLHRATGVSRATFYRLFDTPEDVLHYQLAQMVEASAEEQSSELAEDPEKLLEATIRQGMENSEFLRAVVDNKRFDLLFQYTEEKFRTLDEKRGIFPKDMDPLAREYLLSNLSMSMVATLITWNRNGRRESASDVVRHLKDYARLLWELVREQKEEGKTEETGSV